MQSNVSLWLWVTALACTSVPNTPGPQELGPRPSRRDAGPAPMFDAGAPDVGAPDMGLPDVGDPSRWYQRAIGYEVFVRSFQDSNGDGVGDIDGLRSRLDYIASLGADLIWLMPLNESGSYHGYDVIDYRSVDPRYGTIESLQSLLEEAHARGMRVVLDLVLNHTSRDHAWFQSSASANSPFRDWYIWRFDDPGWSQPWSSSPAWHALGDSYYYGLFWSGMPDLNFQNPEVVQETIDIAKFWLDLGFDGFRLDAVRFFVEDGPGPGQFDRPQTHTFMQTFREAISEHQPTALLVGEVWETTDIIIPYFGEQDSPGLHMAFDFDGAFGIINALKSGSANDLRNHLRTRFSAYPSWGRAGSFLSNHDHVRIASQVDESSLRLAAALLLTLPGTPWIYYGEELGMGDGTGVGGDRAHRRPMQWSEGKSAGFSQGAPWLAPERTARAASVAGQLDQPSSLLEHYRALIQLRRQHPVLWNGDATVLDAGAPTVLAIERKLEDRAIICLYNLGETTARVSISGVLGLQFKDLISGAGYSRTADAPLVIEALAPRAFALIEPAP